MPEPAAEPEGTAPTRSVELTAVTVGRDLHIDQRTIHPEPVPTRPFRLDPRLPGLRGREDLLTTIADRLATAPGPGPRLIVLHGLGGVGKSTVAVEYVHRHQDEYGLVWQLRAEDPTVLSADYRRLADSLDLNDRAESADPIDQVRKALAARSDRWLLLLDNVTDEDAIRGMLPAGGDGEILITTRSALWADDLALEVPVLDRKDAADFLIARSGDTDRPSALALADELGALPLALAQAASYVAATGRSLRWYRTQLDRRRAELLRRGMPWGYENRVASTWELSFRRLRSTVPAAVTLLRLLACCAPDSIPYGLLLMPREEPVTFDDDAIAALVEPLMHDDLTLDDAIVGLRRYSLVAAVADGMVSVHRLVQAITIEELPDERRRAWRSSVAALVAAALPDGPGRPAAWPTYGALVAHARAALAPNHPGTAKLLEYLGASGDYRTARMVQEEVCADATERLGAEHPDALQARAALANWTGMAGHPAAARDALEALLPVCERVWGPNDRRTLRLTGRVADWTGQSGGWARARDICAALLPRLRGAFGDADQDTLAVWAELGFWTGQIGDPAGACAHYAAFLPIREQVLGSDHPDILSGRDQYARWTGENGDSVAARDMCVEVLAVHERVYGGEHDGTLWVRGNLAWWTGNAGDPAGAREQYTALLAVRERVSGPDHPASLVARGNLAYWTARAGDPAGARDQFAILLPIHLRVLGPDHPETLLSRKNLAQWTGEAGDPHSARDQFAAMVADFERVLGHEHAETGAVRTELATWSARCRR
ncbi:FxSxx-COOH system tetratricopeptide repeat protein [Streptomyces sp.]|uniref:FxSxx-COOH system tetratricopeptide repeat protein n=1 Tax=Streptomyces sp. TaxID=1931 RepID=UPI002D77D41E|nr:FxSxx-COOH system tetratricopeptide repeat protein [Streptomyces sp.]HET6355447.1 FxSxx-COOH system tetratricopeptide repeat protein [Streptomyces sp.]